MAVSADAVIILVDDAVAFAAQFDVWLDQDCSAGRAISPVVVPDVFETLWAKSTVVHPASHAENLTEACIEEFGRSVQDQVDGYVVVIQHLVLEVDERANSSIRGGAVESAFRQIEQGIEPVEEGLLARKLSEVPVSGGRLLHETLHGLLVLRLGVTDGSGVREGLFERVAPARRAT